MATPLGQLATNAPVPGGGLADDILATRRRLLVGGHAWSGGAGGPVIAVDGNQPAQGIMWLDPADYAIAGKTMKLRTEMVAFTNAVAPGAVTFEVDLREVTGLTGSSPNFTLAAALAGSVASVVSPIASNFFFGDSGDFTFPAVASYYAICSRIAVGMAANSNVRIAAQLWLRYV